MKFCKKVAIPFEIISLIFKYSPEYFIFFIPQVLFSSFLPLLHVYMPKLIIEALEVCAPYHKIFQIIIVFCILSLFINLFVNYLNDKNTYCIEKFSRKLSAEIGKTIMSISLSDVENTSERDNIRLAQDAVGLIKFCEIIRNIVQNFITIIGYAIIVYSLNIKFFAMIVLLLVVKSLFVYIGYKENLKIRNLNVQNDRTGDYLTNLCYFNQGAAKEIRTNSIQIWFLKKVKMFRNGMVKLQYREFKRTFLFDCINTVILAWSNIYVLWCLAEYYFDNLIMISDFSLYFSTITALNLSLGIITDLIAQYNRQLQCVADYKNLQEMAKVYMEDTIEDNVLDDETLSSVEIRFSNIWFAYPGCTDYVLRDINLCITNREKLVLVGNNGAGKSTFIKLLCKFYRPLKGTITLNGVDIWKIPNDKYYTYLSAVFQDYITFPFTINENITMSDCVDKKIQKVMSDVGLMDFVKTLPDAGDTYISKKFSSDGMEISGGQSQKMALARALYKNAPILILDEPTSSLDLQSESEMYEKFIMTSSDKTTVFISHRLAASQIADHIAVFSDGKIVEYGTHKELILENGIYAEMFEKQSAPYMQENT